MGALDIHICEVVPPKYTWAAILLSVYTGEALGKLLPYLLGDLMFSRDHGENMWHYYVAILSIPSVLFVVIASISADESPAYLWSKGKNVKAIRVLKKFFSEDESKCRSENISKYENLNSSKTKTETIFFWEKVKIVCHNGPVLRSLICFTIMGCSVKYTTYGLSYIATELVFLSGQTDSNYCAGTKSRTYFLKNSDYLVLSAFIISAFSVKVLAMILAEKFILGVKKTASVCLGVSLCLAVCLYAWIALIIYGLIDASSAVVELNYIMFVAKIVPANIRSSIYGIMKFIMYLPLPVTPYLIQVLAQESQHYLTTTTVSFITISFIAVLLIPNNVQVNKE